MLRVECPPLFFSCIVLTGCKKTRPRALKQEDSRVRKTYLTRLCYRCHKFHDSTHVIYTNNDVDSELT